MYFRVNLLSVSSLLRSTQNRDVVPSSKIIPSLLRVQPQVNLRRTLNTLLLHGILDVPTTVTLTVARAGDFRLVTLAIILQTPRPFAIATLRMFPDPRVPGRILSLPDFRPEGVGIPLQTIFYRPLPVLLVVEVIEAVHAVAHVAEFAVGEAVAVKFEALRFGAVAGLSGAHPIRLHFFRLGNHGFWRRGSRFHRGRSNHGDCYLLGGR